MSLEKDLDELMWPDVITFNKSLNPLEWYELDAWCDNTFGKNNWFVGKNRAYFRKEGSSTLFLLRWA